MSFLVLLDLDDTLLGRVSEQFMPAYIEALCKQIPSVVPEKIITQLAKSINLMESKVEPKETLKSIFDQTFYPGIGIPYEDLSGIFEKFYAEIFPGLKRYTQFLPSAVRVVSELFDLGCDIAIATNPLFPMTATHQRLEWAGLPVDKYPFRIVSTYENFHFAKPQPAYLAEILTQTGWQNGQIVMVGDRWDRDIIPAARMGFPTYWTQPEMDVLSQLSDSLHPLSAYGGLDSVSKWVKKVKEELPPYTFSSCSSKMAILSATPAGLDTLCERLTQLEAQYRPAKDAWSIVEIICHLRDADRDVNLPRFQAILETEDFFVAGVDTDKWVEERSYQLEECQGALQDFFSCRSQLIRLIRTLPESRWDNTLRHSIFGPTKPGELIGFIATHDKTHVQQVFDNLHQIKKSTL